MMKRASALAGLALLLILIPCQAFAAVIVVDPGHGGYDGGATGVNGILEKSINLDIARKLADNLREKGYIALLTRNSDTYLGLQQRVDFAAYAGADLFVSIHANAHPSSAIAGSMVLYFDRKYEKSAYPASVQMRELTPQSKALAQSIERQLVLSAGMIDRGIIPSSVYVVRRGSVPSVLVETAFLSNPREAALLANDGFRKQLAAGIAAGIEQYLPPDTGSLDNHWAKAAILRLQDSGIIDKDGVFLPDAGLSRAEFAAMLDRIFHFAKGDTEADIKFADFPESHPAYAALTAAVHNGILHGYDDGLLYPDRTITREEMVVIFDRAIRLSADQLDTDAFPQNIVYFRDVPIDCWSAKAIYRVRDLGLVQGVSETEFARKRIMTKAEGAVILDRYLQGEIPGS